MLYSLLSYGGRLALGVGMALVMAALGVILARMGLLLFGLTSWLAWLTLLIAGAGVGAGLGSAGAWLGLKGAGLRFAAALATLALAAGIGGSWFAYQFGAGVEPACCASPDMGPIAYAVLGATVAANLAALIAGAGGQSILRAWRRRGQPTGLPRFLGQQE